MEKRHERSYSLPEVGVYVNDASDADSSCDMMTRDAILERSRTSPNSRRRGVLSDITMPVQRQGSREHSNHHISELPELREEEPQGADGGIRGDHILETRNAHLHPPLNVGRRSRRSSAPTLLEPIQEGLFGPGRRNSTPTALPLLSRREASLSPSRCGDSPPARSPRLSQKAAHPLGDVLPEEEGFGSALQRRRLSEPDHHIKSLQSNILYTTEGYLPQPRRNSLATATLNDIAARFELLDTRRKVIEEGENREPAMLGAGTITDLRCDGGARAPPPISVTEAHY